MPSHRTSPPAHPGNDRVALAAKASLICPFVVVLLALVTHWMPSELRIVGELAAGAVAVIGLLCAVFALAQWRRSANTSIAIQGGIGFVIGLVFVGIVFNHYLRAQREIQAERGPAGSAPEPGISPQTQRLGESVARFISKTTELEQRLVSAAQPLGASPVLDLTAVDSVEVLLARQSTVKDYLAASHALSNHLAQARGFLEVQMIERGSTPEEAGLNAADFLEHIDPQLTTSRQLRELEYHYSQTLIQALDFLRQRWGAWTIQPHGTPTFATDEVNLEYAAFLQRLDQLEAQDRELKQRLANP
jgi:hypothetical protein